MEPPKKRKYPLETFGSGTCGLDGVPLGVTKESSLEVSEGEPVTNFSDTVVSSQVSLPAKRNRRSYSLEFKVAVLDSYYNDAETRLNQRKTALKYGVNRRQIQKWLAQEETLRGSVGAGFSQNHSLGQVPTLAAMSPVAPPVTSLPPAVSSTCKISPQKLRGPFVTYSPMTPMTILESTPEIGSGSERDFVIDEGGHDGYKSSSFSDLDDQDSKPINLCKFTEIKVENQVTGKTDPAQLPEVGSSVTMTRSHPDPVSSHILDTSRGLPARGVRATMYRMGGEQVWTKLQSRATNDDGRASNFLSWDEFKPGTYKMHFATGEYFKEQKTETFYPYAEVVFEIKDPDAHYHIALLLNPFGYSTYRGS